MIVAVIAFGLAGLAAAVAWRASAPMFGGYVFQRRNYRDHALPTGVGVLVPLVTATLVAILEVTVDPWRRWTSGWLVDVNPLASHGATMVAIVAAFSLLGLVDDLGGAGESGGFRGHIGALAEGRLTTGMVKLAGGVVMSLALLGGFNVSESRLGLVRDAALVCLAANAVNLFDRAPGRAIKVGLAAYGLLAIVTFDGRAAIAALPLGAAAGLLRADLREDLMIGDAGANAIGAALGLSVVLATSTTSRWFVLAAVLGVNLLSEVMSFSRVIDAVVPLRWLDRLGSRRSG